MAFVSALVRKVVALGLWVTDKLSNPILLALAILVPLLYSDVLIGVFAYVFAYTRCWGIAEGFQREFVFGAERIMAEMRASSFMQETRGVIFTSVMAITGLMVLVGRLRREVKVALHNVVLETPPAEIGLGDKPLPEVVKEITRDTPVAERMVVGSDLVNGISPRFQVDIHVAKGGDPKLYYSGVGFRTQNRLVTAMHVVSDATEIAVKNPSTGDYLVIDPSAFVETHVDLTWAVLTDAQWGKLGVAAARLALTVPPMQWVQVTAQGKSTFGHLEEIDAMGMVKYSGSTISGFSGSPYSVNKLVYGVHVGAGTKDNFGFSASFLAALIRKHSNAQGVLHNEDSAEYLMGQLDRFGKDSFEYEISPVDMDSYTVRVGGTYHNVDVEVFDRLRTRFEGRRTRNQVYSEECAREDVSFLEKRQAPEKEKPSLAPQELLTKVPEVAELQPTPRGFAQFPESAHAQGSPAPGPSVVRENAQLEKLIEQNAQLLRSLTRMQSSAMVNHVSTPAPQSGPSHITLESSLMPRPATVRPRPLTKAQKLRQKVSALEAILASLSGQTREPAAPSPQQSLGSGTGVAPLQASVSPMNSLI